MTAQEMYWSEIKHSLGSMIVAATALGLCYVGSPDASCEEVEVWARKLASDYRLVRSDEKMRPYAEQLVHYLEGQRTRFELPLDVRGTTFQQSVWKALMSLPYGKTSVYSDLAEAIGKPNAVRAVGAAIGANPLLIVVPCHRVIGKNGALTGYRGGLAAKSWLLQLEKRQLPV